MSSPFVCIAIPYLFNKFPPGQLDEVPGILLPFNSIALEIISSLESESHVFKDIRSNVDLLREIAGDILSEVLIFDQFLDWAYKEGGLNRADEWPPHNSNAEVLVQFLNDKHVSESFLQSLEKYKFQDTTKVIVAIQLLTELDLLSEEYGQQLRTGQMSYGVGVYLKSIGMLYSFWQVGIPKVIAQRKFSEEMKRRGSKKGALLREEVLKIVSEQRQANPKIRTKDLAEIIAQLLWKNPTIQDLLKKEGVQSEGDFRLGKVLPMIYNHCPKKISKAGSKN